MTTKAPARPRRSGFCNPTLPRTDHYDPHTNCRMSACTCTCHVEPTMPVHIDPAVQQQAAAGVLTPRPTTPTQTPEEDVEEFVTRLHDDADGLNVALKGYAPEDWRDAVRLLHRLRTAVGTLRDLDASLVQWLYLHGEHGMHQHIDGVPGEFAITRGRTKERWAAPEAVQAYVETQLERTGEVPDPLQVVAWVLEVLPATQSTSLRKTPLKDAGLDLSEYYWSEPGTLQVSTPRT